MINNKFVHFNRKDTFIENEPDIREDSLVFIKESNEILAKDELYSFISWGVIEPSDYCKFYTIDGDYLVESSGKEFLVLRDDI